MATVQDESCLFRMGVVIAASEETKVFHRDDGEEWLSAVELGKIEMPIKCGDEVFVDRKIKDTGEIVGRCKWDTEEDWPANAKGGASVDVPFNF